MKRLIILFSAILCALTIRAYDFSMDGIRYNFVDDQSVAVTSAYDEYSGDVIIPSHVTYEGTTYAVTVIEEDAFEGCEDLTSLKLPNTLKFIQSGAITQCPKLTSLHIPASVDSIAPAAVYGCSAMTSITVASGNTHYDSRDNCNAVIDKATNTLLFGCSKTVIPKSVSHIGLGAFAFCKSLESITIPSGVSTIGQYAFLECSNLEQVTVPASVTAIADGAFDNTDWYYAQPDGVLYINKVLYRYKGTMPDNHFVVVKEGTVSISPEAFASQSHLTHITIPNSVTHIGHQAFDGCSGLQSVVLPNKLKVIEYATFDGCSNIQNLTLPKSLKMVQWYAFNDCDIDHLHYTGDIASWCDIRFIGSEANPIGASGNLYINGKSLTNLVIPSSVDSIQAYAFAGLTMLDSITIPKSVKKIGEYAFDKCTGLDQTRYTGDIASWCAIDFANASANPVAYSSNLVVGDVLVQDLVIPSGVTRIGKYAFAGCNLLSVTLPASIQYIGDYAFQDCDWLTTTRFMGDIAAWCAIDFANPTANPVIQSTNLVLDSTEVVDLVIPEGVQKISNYAFYNCTSIQSVSIPSSVREIGEATFSYCEQLGTIYWNAHTMTETSPFAPVASQITSLTFGPDVDSVPAKLCYQMESLQQVTLPASITHIGAGAFSLCDQLQRTNYLGDVASWCNIQFDSPSANPIYQSNNLYINGQELRELVVPHTATAIHDNAFYNCHSLVSVTIPSSVRSIGQNAFFDCRNINMTQYIGDVASWSTIDFSCVQSNPIYYSHNLYINGQELRELVLDSAQQVNHYAFAACRTLTSLSLQDSVQVVGKLAFADCRNLASISIANSVKDIHTSAFDDCSSLTDITWNAGDYTGDYPFANVRDQIRSITFGDAIKTIPAYFCYDMTALSQLHISSSVTTIGGYAFGNCNALKSAELGTSVVSLEDGVFYGCDELHTITLNRRLQHIGEDAFLYSNKLAKVNYRGKISNWCNIHFDNKSANPLAIAHNLHMEGAKQTHLNLPYSVDTIRPYAFAGYTSLASITIPVSVKNIGYKAFDGCSAIQQIHIPSSVTTINSHAFDDCKSLTTIHWNANSYTGLLPFGDVRNQITTVVFGDSITTVPASFCAGMSQLAHLSIPQSVTAIGNAAFLQCTSLSRVTLPTSVRVIGDNAFAECKSLASITIPQGVHTIGNRAFTECEALSYVDVPASLTHLGDAAFRKCAALKTVQLPESLTRIGESTFFDCVALTDIQLPSTIKEIDDYAFYQCTALDTLLLPNQLKYIGTSAFEGCMRLRYLSVPQAVTSILSNAFYGCNALATISWNAETYTGPYPFKSIASKVKNFIFGENVKHITSLFCEDMSTQTAIMWRATDYDCTVPLRKVLKQVVGR